LLPNSLCRWVTVNTPANRQMSLASIINTFRKNENSFNNTIPIVSISTSDSLVRKHIQDAGLLK